MANPLLLLPDFLLILLGWVLCRRTSLNRPVWDAVERLVRFCETGPSGARVARVEVFDEPPEGLDGFRLG